MFAKPPKRATRGLPYSFPTSAGPHRWQDTKGAATTTAGSTCTWRPRPTTSTTCYWVLSSYSRGFVRCALRTIRWIFVPMFLFCALILTSRNHGRTMQFMAETHHQDYDLLPLTATPTIDSYSQSNGNQASTATSRLDNNTTSSSDMTTPRCHHITTRASKVDLFEEKYRSHYAQNSSDFFTQVKGIANKTWQPNINNSREFRDGIRQELGRAGSLQNFLLTKNNTHKGQRMKFYMYGTSQGISPALLKYLPKASPFKAKQYRSCSVVGSSGFLRGSHCGNEIDNSEFVFRFNIAPVKGFEDDVGRKINFTTLNPSFVRTKLNSFKSQANRTRFANILKQFRGSYLWLSPFAVSDNVQIVQKTTEIAANYKIATPIHGHPEHFVAVANVWRKIAHVQKTWPTTGLYFILSILDICERINVFGFWPFQTALDGSNVTYHYHDDVPGKKNVHSFYTEFRQLVYLHQLGIIQMFFHPCHVK